MSAGGTELTDLNFDAGVATTQDGSILRHDIRSKDQMRLLTNRTWQDALNFTLSFGILLLILVFLGLILNAAFQKTTEIELIAAPKNFAEEKGYTPDVAARQLEDALLDALATLDPPATAALSRVIIDRKAGDSGTAQPGATRLGAVDVFVSSAQQPVVALVSERPTIVVPGVGVSMDSLASMISAFLCPTCRKVITGEFTISGGHLWLIVRANHHIVFVNKAGGDPDKPQDLVRQAAAALFDAVHPEAAAIGHNNIGNIKYRDGKLQEAIDEYRCAIKLHDQLSVYHYNLGNALRDAHDPDGAATEYRRAAELDPQDARPHTGLGLVYGSTGKPDDAVAEYRTAINLNPNDAVAQSNLGAALSGQGKPGEAIERYKAAIALDPSAVYALYNQGNALYTQGDFVTAEKAYRDAARLNPNLDIVHVGLGRALLGQGRHVEAITEYRRAVELNQTSASDHGSLAYGLRVGGVTDEAFSEVREAIRLDPAARNAQTTLAVMLLDEGKAGEAIQILQDSIKSNPGYAYQVLRLHLARLSMQQDDRTELNANAERVDQTAWPAPILHYYLGRTNKDAVYGAVASGSDYARRGQKCEADYYLGVLASRQGKTEDALSLLGTAASDCPPNFYEAASAAIELRALAKRETPNQK